MATIRTSWETHELQDLIGDLRRVPAKVEAKCRRDVRDAAQSSVKAYRANARASSGEHGKLFPGTITADILAGGLTAELGPESAMDQGGMGRGFEWGSPSTISNFKGGGWFRGAGGRWFPGGFPGQRVGQTGPHLPMTKAMDVEEPKFVKAIANNADDWW